MSINKDEKRADGSIEEANGLVEGNVDTNIDATTEDEKSVEVIETKEETVETKEAPVEVKEAPAEVKEAPVEVKEAPVEVKEAPKEPKKQKLDSMETKLKRLKLVTITLSALLCLGAVCFAFYFNSTNNSDTQSSGVVEKVNGRELKEYTKKIEDAMSKVRGENTFIAVQDGEETGVVLVYNKNGEAFAQSSDSSYITVYRDDHKAVRYTEYVDFGYDSDVLSILDNVSKMAKNGKTTVLKDKLPNKDGFTSYVVDIRGWDATLELYSMFDEEFGELMIDQLKQSLGNTEEINSNLEEINFRFVYILDDESSLYSAECYVYFGKSDSTDITMSQLGLSWKFDGIHQVSDWALEEGWYSKDWDTLSEWSDISMAEELLTKQYEILSKIVDELEPVEEENIGTTSDGQVENSEQQEPSTDNTSDSSNSTDSSLTDSDVDSSTTNASDITDTPETEGVTENQDAVSNSN